MLALQKFHSTKIEGKKKLIEDNPLVSIVIGLKKIPNKSFKPHRMYERERGRVISFVSFIRSSESDHFIPLTLLNHSFPLFSAFVSLPSLLSVSSFFSPSSLIPHSLYPADETELCLFTRHDKKTTKELLERKGVKTVQKVSSSHSQSTLKF